MQQLKSKNTNAETLQSSVCPVSKLTIHDKETMFSLMESYYKDTCRIEFMEDLADKNDVIVLREQISRKIVGFSTLKYFDLSHLREKSLGVFSGDTIVEQKYWGQTSLQKCFLFHLCKLKIQHTGSKIYWFLISKGYKTYLLMANNFPVHYPRIEQHTPVLYKKMMAEIYTKIYPETYIKDRDLIQNAGKSYSLRNGIAAPTDSLIKQLPRVRFFVEKNPHWHAGDELACIAEMDYGVLGRYLAKALKKSFGLNTQQLRRA